MRMTFWTTAGRALRRLWLAFALLGLLLVSVFFGRMLRQVHASASDLALCGLVIPAGGKPSPMRVESKGGTAITMQFPGPVTVILEECEPKGGGE